MRFTSRAKWLIFGAGCVMMMGVIAGAFNQANIMVGGGYDNSQPGDDGKGIDLDGLTGEIRASGDILTDGDLSADTVTATSSVTVGGSAVLTEDTDLPPNFETRTELEAILTDTDTIYTEDNISAVTSQIPDSLEDFEVDLSGVSDEYILRWNQVAGKFITEELMLPDVTNVPENLDDLADVTVEGDLVGKVLAYDETLTQWVPIDKVTLLSHLSDVAESVDEATDDQVLYFSGGLWIAQDAITELDDLSNVSGAAGADTGDVLRFDGVGYIPWNPETANLDDHADVDYTGLADGYGLRWDSGSGMWLPYDLSQFTLEDVFGADFAVLKDGDSLVWNQVAGKFDPKTTYDWGNWFEILHNNLNARRLGNTIEVFDGEIYSIAGSVGSITGVLTLADDILQFENQNKWVDFQTEPGFGGRRFHDSTVQDSKLWVIGGATEIDPVTGNIQAFSNDIWYSSDGETWTEVENPVNTEDPGVLPIFANRAGHQVITFGGKIWVIGGFNEGGPINDVWSSPDGVNWTEKIASVPWGARYFFKALVFDSKIWVIGGQGGSGFYQDVWFYPDTGAGDTFEEATNDAGFGERSLFSLAEYDSEMWVIGGVDSKGNIYRTSYTSSDGTTWTQGPTLNERVAYGNAVELDNVLYSFKTISESTRSLVEYTLNGEVWDYVRERPPFGSRAFAASTAVEGFLVFLGGENNSGIVNDTNLYASPEFAGGWDGLPFPDVARTRAASAEYRTSFGVSSDSKLVITGGNTASGNVDSTWFFDPATNGWDEKASIPDVDGIQDHTMVSYNVGTIDNPEFHLMVIGGLTRVGDDLTVDLVNDKWTVVDEGVYSADQKVILTGTDPSSPLVSNTDVIYFVIKNGDGTISLSATSGGGAIDLTDRGSNVVTVWRATSIETVDLDGGAVDDSVNTITVADGTAYGVGLNITLEGSDLPEPLVENVVYFIHSINGNDIRLSESSGGSIIDITDAGTGDMDIFEFSSNENIDLDSGVSIVSNKVWVSEDGGASWSQINGGGGSGIDTIYGHSSAVLNDEIYVIGGGNDEEDSTDVSNRVFKSTLEEPYFQTAPIFPGLPRRFHSSVVFDGRLWVIGGVDSTGAALNDMWYTENGRDWYLYERPVPWSPRYGMSANVDNNRLYLLGGTDGTTWFEDFWMFDHNLGPSTLRGLQNSLEDVRTIWTDNNLASVGDLPDVITVGVRDGWILAWDDQTENFSPRSGNDTFDSSARYRKLDLVPNIASVGKFVSNLGKIWNVQGDDLLSVIGLGFSFSEDQYGDEIYYSTDGSDWYSPENEGRFIGNRVGSSLLSYNDNVYAVAGAKRKPVLVREGLLSLFGIGGENIWLPTYSEDYCTRPLESWGLLIDSESESSGTVNVYHNLNSDIIGFDHDIANPINFQIWTADPSEDLDSPGGGADPGFVPRLLYQSDGPPVSGYTYLLPERLQVMNQDYEANLRVVITSDEYPSGDIGAIVLQEGQFVCSEQTKLVTEDTLVIDETKNVPPTAVGPYSGTIDLDQIIYMVKESLYVWSVFMEIDHDLPNPPYTVELWTSAGVGGALDTKVFEYLTSESTMEMNIPLINLQWPETVTDVAVVISNSNDVAVRGDFSTLTEWGGGGFLAIDIDFESTPGYFVSGKATSLNDLFSVARGDGWQTEDVDGNGIYDLWEMYPVVYLIDFTRHPDASVLKAEIDALIEDLITNETTPVLQMPQVVLAALAYVVNPDIAIEYATEWGIDGAYSIAYDKFREGNDFDGDGETNREEYEKARPVDLSSDSILVANESVYTGDQEVTLTGLDLPVPLEEDTSYYVIKNGDGTISLSATEGGGAIDLLYEGSGNVDIVDVETNFIVDTLTIKYVNQYASDFVQGAISFTTILNGMNMATTSDPVITIDYAKASVYVDRPTGFAWVFVVLGEFNESNPVIELYNGTSLTAPADSMFDFTYNAEEDRWEAVFPLSEWVTELGPNPYIQIDTDEHPSGYLRGYFKDAPGWNRGLEIMPHGWEEGYATNDVYRTTDAESWVTVTENADFPPRYNQAVAVFDGDIYVSGGQIGNADFLTASRYPFDSDSGYALSTTVPDRSGVCTFLLQDEQIAPSSYTIVPTATADEATCEIGWDFSTSNNYINITHNIAGDTVRGAIIESAPGQTLEHIRTIKDLGVVTQVGFSTSLTDAEMKDVLSRDNVAIQLTEDATGDPRLLGQFILQGRKVYCDEDVISEVITLDHFINQGTGSNFSDDVYFADDTIVLNTTITTDLVDSDTLTYEVILPATWSLNSFNTAVGPDEDSASAPGSTGTLTFTWNSWAGNTSIEVEVTINVPAGQTGGKTLSHQATYVTLDTGSVDISLSEGSDKTVVIPFEVSQDAAGGDFTLTVPMLGDVDWELDLTGTITPTRLLVETLTASPTEWEIDTDPVDLKTGTITSAVWNAAFRGKPHRLIVESAEFPDEHIWGWANYDQEIITILLTDEDCVNWPNCGAAGEDGTGWVFYNSDTEEVQTAVKYESSAIGQPYVYEAPSTDRLFGYIGYINDLSITKTYGDTKWYFALETFSKEDFENHPEPYFMIFTPSDSQTDRRGNWTDDVNWDLGSVLFGSQQERIYSANVWFSFSGGSSNIRVSVEDLNTLSIGVDEIVVAAGSDILSEIDPLYTYTDIPSFSYSTTVYNPSYPDIRFEVPYEDRIGKEGLFLIVRASDTPDHAEYGIQRANFQDMGEWSAGLVRPTPPIKLYNDLWVSGDGGSNWNQIIPNGSWPEGIATHWMGAYDEKLVIVGGSISPSLDEFSNTVYFSSDGLIWDSYIPVGDPLASPPTTLPKTANPSATVFDNKLWISTGLQLNENDSLALETPTLWTTVDLSTFNRVYPNNAVVLNMSGHSLLEHNDNMWALGGVPGYAWTESTLSLQNVQYSIDGLNWLTSRTVNPPYSTRISPVTVWDNEEFPFINFFYGGIYLDEGISKYLLREDAWLMTPTNVISVSSDFGNLPGLAATNFVYLDGKIYVFGGYSNSITTLPTDEVRFGVSNLTYWNDFSVDSYEIENDGWESGESNLNGTVDHAFYSWNEKLYTFGGKIPQSTVNGIYESTDGLTWSEVGTFSSFTFPVYGMRVIEFNNELYSIGGFEDDGNSLEVVGIHKSVDGVNWSEVDTNLSNSVDFNRTFHNVYSVDGKLWVVGGETTSGSPAATTIWTSDGETWYQDFSNRGATTINRGGYFSYPDGGIVIGGANHSGGLNNFIWWLPARLPIWQQDQLQETLQDVDKVWTDVNLSLFEQLPNVNDSLISALQDGDSLVWDAGSSEFTREAGAGTKGIEQLNNVEELDTATYENDQMLVWDVQSDSWVAKATGIATATTKPFTLTKMAVREPFTVDRTNFASVFVAGTLYVFGGSEATTADNIVETSTDGGYTWQTVATSYPPTSNDGLTAHYFRGDIITVGGDAANDVIYVADGINVFGSWTTEAIGYGAFDVINHASARDEDGTHLYVSGGEGFNKFVSLNSSYVPTVVNNIHPGGNFYDHSMVVVPNHSGSGFASEQIFIIGGIVDSAISDDVIRSTNGGSTWGVVASLPVPCANGQAWWDENLLELFYLAGNTVTSSNKEQRLFRLDGAYEGTGFSWKEVYLDENLGDGDFIDFVRVQALPAEDVWFMGGETDSGAISTIYKYHTSFSSFDIGGNNSPDDTWQFTPEGVVMPNSESFYGVLNWDNSKSGGTGIEFNNPSYFYLQADSFIPRSKVIETGLVDQTGVTIDVEGKGLLVLADPTSGNGVTIQTLSGGIDGQSLTIYFAVVGDGTDSVLIDDIGNINTASGLDLSVANGQFVRLLFNGNEWYVLGLDSGE